jgi:hypothetical protein
MSAGTIGGTTAAIGGESHRQLCVEPSLPTRRTATVETTATNRFAAGDEAPPLFAPFGADGFYP